MRIAAGEERREGGRVARHWEMEEEVVVSDSGGVEIIGLVVDRKRKRRKDGRKGEEK
jgi:hypothetical protein